MLAATEINANGGINGEAIELIFADVGVAPAEATQSALRLWKGEGVQAFVGMHDSAVREALIAASTVKFHTFTRRSTKAILAPTACM